MWETITPALIDVGPWGLLVASWMGFVGMILRGGLVPKSTHDTFVQAWETEKAARAEVDGQNAELLELSRTTVSMLTSIKAAAERGSTTDAPETAPRP